MNPKGQFVETVTCPHCYVTLRKWEMTDPLHTEPLPVPGTVGKCLVCGELSKVMDDLSLGKLTADEMVELEVTL